MGIKCRNLKFVLFSTKKNRKMELQSSKIIGSEVNGKIRY